MQKNIISNKNKIKISIWAGVYIVLFLAFLTIMLEGLGTFVGIIDKPVADSYIDKYYSGITCSYKGFCVVNEKTVNLGVETTTKAYRFTYEVTSVGTVPYGTLKAGDTFSIDVYNFEVKNDSIYMEKTVDNELLTNVNAELLKNLQAFYDTQEDVKFSVLEAYIDIKPTIGEYDGVEAVLASEEIKECDSVIHLVGEKTDFETYKTVVAPIVRFYSEANRGSIPRPENLQIFYYYYNENGEKVMEYESQLTDFADNEVLYTEELVGKSSENIHYKVELDEDDTRTLKTYQTVKTIYLVVVAGAVIVLYTLFTYRKIKKLVLMGNEL